LTAMKNGVYAMLAVVVGVALVGLLPGQLSNLATPTMERASLQGVSKEAAGNTTTTADSVTGTKTDDTGESVGFTVTATYDPYADVMYYGSWGIGLLTAFGVYFIAKRILG